MKRATGHYERTAVGGRTVDAFVPEPLPPTPPLEIAGPLAERLRSAEEALARLDLAGALVPSIDWLLDAFVRKEAVVSSQIEGTQATLVDLLRFETSGGTEPGPDVEEVCNYVDALRFAREQLAAPNGLPLSLRLLDETHRRLMRGVRGADKRPGEVRRSQNWIGGTRPEGAVFVPPPPHLLPDLLGAFEQYLHAEGVDLPPIVRAGLAHV
jgi:Fic family protein